MLENIKSSVLKSKNISPFLVPSEHHSCEAVNGHCKLKRNHAYFAQVQGQMGVSGASWCDFIVYTKKGISVERIAFDPAYWAELRQKLAS